ncbi:Hypothetical protein, putative [Bodo saltans]|uniref:Uncharacterized protein n=1 Tax=Bodo saltans TaxID=75058 RepID=A0A0S4IVA2_BODSA|nr:Hypothetical protein, putative [Bodo saltans]|eukprot:CUF08344.1 Hypothetical protein, putative [Bodo saltans]
MRKSISLKEFSTTPTVSCMLRKDGNNVAAETAPTSTVVRTSTVVPPQSTQAKQPTSQPAQPQGESEGMWEME